MKQPKLKIGQTVKVIKGISADSYEFNGKNGIITKIVPDWCFKKKYVQIKFDDGKVSNTGIWEDELQLIKPKTKKVKKYKYSREEIIKMYCSCDIWEINQNGKFIDDLLATQPKPVKEECKHNFQYADGISDSACYRTCTKCGEVEEPKPNTNSKEIKPLEFKFKKETLHSIDQGTTLHDIWLKQCEIIDVINSLTNRK